MDTTKKDPERGKKYKYKVHDNHYARQITMCSFRLSHLTSIPVIRLTAKSFKKSMAKFNYSWTLLKRISKRGKKYK